VRTCPEPCVAGTPLARAGARSLRLGRKALGKSVAHVLGGRRRYVIRCSSAVMSGDEENHPSEFARPARQPVSLGYAERSAGQIEAHSQLTQESQGKPDQIPAALVRTTLRAAGHGVGIRKAPSFT
jgi:hypothetical protein